MSNQVDTEEQKTDRRIPRRKPRRATGVFSSRIGIADGDSKKSVRGSMGGRGSKWRTSSLAVADHERCLRIYDKGLQYARKRNVGMSRRMLGRLISMFPEFEPAWVTLAQVEKWEDRDVAGRTLREAIRANPRSSAILQAWGLHLLQENGHKYDLMAYGLLDSAVRHDPSYGYVLRWKRVREIGREWRRERHRNKMLRLRAKKALTTPEPKLEEDSSSSQVDTEECPTDETEP